MADQTLITNEGAIDANYPTNSDLSALQYHAVKLDASEEVVACGANDAHLGILQNAPDGSSEEKTAVIRVQGMSKLSLAETVAADDMLTSTAASKGEVVDAAGEEIIAQALTSAESGDIARVIVFRGRAQSSYA